MQGSKDIPVSTHASYATTSESFEAASAASASTTVVKSPETSFHAGSNSVNTQKAKIDSKQAQRMLFDACKEGDESRALQALEQGAGFGVAFMPDEDGNTETRMYIKMETEIKRQEFEKNFSVEPTDIHQKMYEIATKNHNTTLDLNPPAGAENFHEGPCGWNSGNGWAL